jgi:hypothetical protein
MLSAHEVTLTVLLPPGVATPLDSLKVINAAGSFAVATNGEVTVTYWNEGHHYATVTDANGKPLLLAFVGPDSKEISVVTTAQVLAYFRLGGWALTQSGQVALSNALTPKAVQAITDLLLQLFAQSEDVLTTSSPQLKAVLDQTAVALRDLPLKRAIVDPEAEQSGIGVTLSRDEQSLTVTNRKHRRAYAYVTQESFRKPEEDRLTRHPLTPPRAVADFTIFPTTGVHSLFGTIADILSGNVPFQEVESAPVAVSIQDDQGNQSGFTIPTIPRPANQTGCALQRSLHARLHRAHCIQHHPAVAR